MFKRIKKAKLGRKASHTRALVKNMQRSLFEMGYLTTTSVKAKVLKQEVTRLLLSLKKSQTLEEVRRATITLGDRKLVERVIAYAKENDPKVKIVKIGYRDGDKAQTSRVSVVGYSVKKTKKIAKEEKKKEVKEEAKPEVKQVKPVRTVGKAIKETFARKERSRTRSGL